MSFDAFTMPAVPQPAANSVNSSPGTDPAPMKLDQSAQPADQKESFMATLNRVSERRSGGHDRSDAADGQACRSAKPHNKAIHQAGSDNPVDQDGKPEVVSESDLTESIPETPLVCKQSVMDLMNMLFADDGVMPGQIQTQTAHISAPVELKALMGLFSSEGQTMFRGQLDSGPFEQLQTNISPEVSNLSFLRQLLNRAIVHQFAGEPSDPKVDHSILAFWRSVAAMPVEGAAIEGQTANMTNRIDTLLNFIRQRFDQLSPPSETAAAAVEADGKEAVLKGQTVYNKEDLFWQKIMRAAQPADTPSEQTTQPTGAEKDSRPSVEAAKVLQPETLVQAHVNKLKAQTEPAGSQTVVKAVEPAITPNAAVGGNASKLTQEMVSLKPSGLQNDLLAADPTGSKVIQIDGEAKDSGFLASQESLPEHLTKLEHAGRSAEGAQRSLAAQTMNQVVQKAVLLNANGQNTVQIDLKPEFLGHIRMQIVTEGQQVAVRIMAEIPFVKDMLENNLNQLKTELQAQGLEVDELEVSVAHDSRADDDLYQKAAEARRARASKNNGHNTDSSAEEHRITRPVSGRGLVDSAIDFFA